MPREKIAILGGGMAAVAAAFELTRSNEQRDRFEVTIYQQGWRLGGKGASGRNLDQYDRIEEHGLHVWLGWYDNAFRLMRECYDQLGRTSGEPLATWQEAFRPTSTVGLEELHNGEWRHFMFEFPKNAELPGEPTIEGGADRMWEYIRRSLIVLRGLLSRLADSLDAKDAREQLELVQGGPTGVVFAPAEPELALMSRAGMAGAAQTLLSMVRSPVAGIGALPLLTALEVAEAMVATAMRQAPQQRSDVLALLRTLVARVQGQAQRALGTNDDARRLWELTELVMANLRGVIADDLLSGRRALDSIDHLDYRDWLRRHGASELALGSAVLKGIYDLAFAYEDGDPARPRVAAGTALRLTLNLFLGYKGAIFWKMQAGMGDTVFVPFYQVLKDRGVRFRFFHRIMGLHLSPNRRRKRIQRISYIRQADVTAGREAYDPLVQIKELPCWPATPRYDQLTEGVELANHLEASGETLESYWSTWDRHRDLEHLDRGGHFDRVIFAISLGAVRDVCRELIGQSPRWRQMVERVGTVQTQAFQVWLKRDLKGSGWPWPDQPPIIAAYTEPFDTWAEMTHLLPREGWDAEGRTSQGQVRPAMPPEHRPKSVMYFCNALSDQRAMPAADAADGPAFVRQQQERVAAAALGFLNGPVRQLWPNLVDAYPDRFQWKELAQEGGPELSARFASQYSRANVDPSERYVLTLPGSNEYRIAPGDTGYENLVIAGDWTDCDINAGCIEAAAWSGILAAAAIEGRPPHERISGFFQP